MNYLIWIGSPELEKVTTVQPPEEAELKIDIESLKKWRDELEARLKLAA
ncbi:hypothetical protein [Pseudomonas syringae]|nr:hypothetical protein [Pseudomonas syringae]